MWAELEQTQHLKCLESWVLFQVFSKPKKQETKCEERFDHVL